MGEHDSSTDPDVPVSPDEGRIQAGEANLPDEHTARVRAYRGEQDQQPEPSADLDSAAFRSSREAPETSKRVYDGTEVVRIRTRPVPEEPPSPPPPEDIARAGAERARRDRKRERDRRAERTALRTVLLLFLGIGGAGIVAVNLLMEDTPPGPVVSGDVSKTKAKGTSKSKQPAHPRVRSVMDETPDLPALRYLRSEGLTVAAEGLPEVSVVVPGPNVSRWAALETCRFAYGVWEFSPNRRFRFLTTCGPLRGTTLVGAYEVDGTVIRMSPLVSPPVRIVSEFEVARPSKIRSAVVVQAGDAGFQFSVEQRATVIRPGLNGDAFYDAFVGKNRLEVRGTGRAPPPKPAKAPKPAGLKKLLEGGP